MKWRLPLIVWSLILLFLTWYPKIEMPDLGFDAQDKAAHFAAFFVLAFLACRAFSKYEIIRLPRAVKQAVLFSISFAVIDEMVQLWIPGRLFDFVDAAANLAGVAAASITFREPLVTRMESLRHRRKAMIKSIFAVILFLAAPIRAAAQVYSDWKPSQPPRILLGGDYAAFRISLKSFEQVYDGRWGTHFGAFGGLRVYGIYYLAVKYGSFHQEGREKASADRWQEQWYKVGVRIRPIPEGRWGSYYGFGPALFRLEETATRSAFSLGEKGVGRRTGSGFYMEAAVDYHIRPEAAVYLEAEVASGGIRGRTGFEAMSIGGWRFAAGLSVQLF